MASGRQVLVSRFALLLATFGLPVGAQEPACVAVPESGRSCVDVILVDPRPGGLGRTGSSAFAADDEPGNDSGPLNHVIRSLDLLHYELRYRVLHETAQNVRIRVQLPIGLDFADVPNPNFSDQPIPAFCGGNSTISGQVLDCSLGAQSDGQTRNVVVLAQPKFGSTDGTIVRADIRISADNQQTTGPVQRLGYQDPVTGADLVCSETRLGQPVTMSPCGDIVSAAPRFDLEFSGYASTNLLDRGARGPQINRRALNTSLTTVVGGAAGRAGFVLAYPVAIALPGDGVGGGPVAQNTPITLTQRLRNSDALAGFGELVGCGLNGNLDPLPNGSLMSAGWAMGETQAIGLKAVFHPYGRGDFVGANTQNAVQDSGTFTCTQSVAGGDITLTLNPAATTFAPAGFPARQVDNQLTPRRYVMVGLVKVFYPAEPVLTPTDGGTGDGSVTVRHDLGVLDGGAVRALSIQGIGEPDASAINDGFGGVQTYDDDNNNFSIATLESSGTVYRKHWRNPRRDNAMAQNEFCLKDGTDPACRHGHVFPGTNIQSEFFFDHAAFTGYPNAQFCDEWDPTRTPLRRPFDPLADPFEFPPNLVAYLDLGGANGSDAVLNGAGIRVEVSTDAGTIPNIDWDSVEPARTNSRSQLSAPECGSGTWQAATLPANLTNGINGITLPAALEIPPGSGRYPTIRRLRVVMDELPPFVQFGFRGSHDVTASVPGQRLPNRTSFRLNGTGQWVYAENDHAIIRVADTSITMTAARNLTTGANGPLTSIGFGEVFETTVQTTFLSGAVNPGPANTPLIVRSYLPVTLDYLGGSASPALFTPPYAGTNPETGQPATVLEWRFANPVPGQPVPLIAYHAQLSVGAGNGANIHSVATVEHALDTGPLFVEPIFASLEDRLALQDLTAVVPVGLLVSKMAETPFIEMDTSMRWRLLYANTSGAPFSTLRLIDVLPVNGDPVNSGNLFDGQIDGGSLTGINSGEHLVYTTQSATADINRNPNCVSNGGSLPDGQGACPASGATWLPSQGAIPVGSTAVRIDDTNGLSASSAQTLTLELATDGNRAGNRYENSFNAVAPGESLAIATSKVQVRVPSGELRGSVYGDYDSSGTPSIGDGGIGSVALTLTGTDVAGNDFVLNTQSLESLQATSTINRMRVNGGPETVFTCVTTVRLTRGEFLFCRLPSANAEGYTLTETQPADWLDRNETLGSLTNGGAPGSVGNDVFTGIRLGNNLTTGAGDAGRGYHFGEFPIYADLGGRVYLEGSVPPNLLDDEDEDPPLQTTLRVFCNPAGDGDTTANTNFLGNYQFLRVPVGANCVITQTQPAGFNNAYNTMGPGGQSDVGGLQGGRIDSEIRLIVPPTGSFGNNFAETLSVAGQPPQKVPLSNPALALLVLLLLGGGWMWIGRVR